MCWVSGVFACLAININRLPGKPWEFNCYPFGRRTNRAFAASGHAFLNTWGVRE